MLGSEALVAGGSSNEVEAQGRGLEQAGLGSEPGCATD